MNLILMQNGFPPVIIRKQDRLLYYQHLITANDGDIRPFIRFIADCTERTLDAYLLATKENSLAPFTSEDNENIIAVQVGDPCFLPLLSIQFQLPVALGSGGSQVISILGS